MLHKTHTIYLLSTINERILRFNTKINGNNGEEKVEPLPVDGIESVKSEDVGVVNPFVWSVFGDVVVLVVVIVVVVGVMMDDFIATVASA